MERIDEVRKFVKAVDAQTLALGIRLEPILKKSLEELLASIHGLSPVDRIPILNNFTYTLIAVIFSCMKVQGINTDTHPIMKELNRVKAAMARYKELQLNTHDKEKAEKEEAERAREFLQNALGIKGSLGGAVNASSAEPAISKSNFQGKHTKFTDSDTDKASPKKTTNHKGATLKSNINAGKVSKPKKSFDKEKRAKSSKK